IFKDLTGVALNQTNGINALKTSIKAGQEFASKAGALAQQKFLNQELDRTVAQIKSARDKGLITDEQARTLTESAIRGSIGEKRPKTEVPTNSPEVQKAMRRVPGAKKGSMRITNPNGTVEVTTGNGTAVPRIDVEVDPPVGFVEQPSNMTCWAAGVTMMVSWRDQQSATIETVLQGLGGDWLTKFQANDGLAPAEIRALLASINAVEEGPVSYSPEGLARLLEDKGPLFEIGDDSVVNNLVIHVRIITAIKGDGTPEGTIVTLLDSADGLKNIPFTEFDQRHGGSDVVLSGLGIFHF